ncbi:DUF4382 domain-containing protein [Hydrogenophaga sp.]|uniref:DUF4382 domain-containing protein n=1 Tax=Hydrogenophaga sp. TaxID=1904254 RepID=UPI00351F392B
MPGRCGDAGGGGGGTADSGTLRLALTDAPACGYDEVNVTVEKIRVHQSSSAGENERGWSEIVLATPSKINLLDLTNGALIELGETRLPAGTYTQLRLVLAANPGNPNVPLANSIRLSAIPEGSGQEIPLKTPSGQQSGLKINVNMTVEADQRADFVLDFDACKSVVVAGNSGNYNLKPVVRAILRTETGVIGEVLPAMAGAAVSLQLDGLPVRSTVADAEGKFRLWPVESGTYTLVVTAPGRATAVVKNVVVSQNQIVRVTPDGTDIAPAVSATGTLRGLVAYNPVATPIDATVNAWQSLPGGTTIQLVSRPVDMDTGAYVLGDLAVGAPEVATFFANGTPIFTPEGTVAGKLRVSAVSGGITRTSSELTLTPMDDQTVPNFTFP